MFARSEFGSPHLASSPRASVCMATYNGAEFIRAQLASILEQLQPDDEVVIVDDHSSDDTVAIVRALHDPRIVVLHNDQNLGYVRSFARAMTVARGDVLLLSDQDDIWAPGRRDALVSATESGGVVASNLALLESGEPLPSPISGRPWLLRRETGNQRLRNQLRILAGNAPYYGCAMAIHRNALKFVLPLPAYLTESHDLWIATVANHARALRHLDRVTVLRRVHENNASTPKPRSVRQALRSRLLLIRLWIEAVRRARRTLV